MTSGAVRRDWWRILGLSALLFVGSAALSVAPVARDLALRLTDSYFRLTPARQQSRVVLVLIDDDSLRQVGRWPWSRTILAGLTRKLSQAGASVIGLDILLSEPQSPEADAELQAALGQRTVLADKIGTYPEGPRWTEPLPRFSGAAGAVGHALAPLDRDGVCRRFPPIELTTDGPRWAFAVELARRVDPQRTSAFLAAYGIQETDDAGPLRIARPILTPISYRNGGFETLSAASVLQGRGLDGVRNRPVLLGFGPAEITDRVMTPVNGELPMPGVEVHAQIFDAIVNGRTLRELPTVWRAIALALTSVVSVLAFGRFRGWFAALAAVAIAAAAYAGGWLAFLQAARLLPVGSMMLAVVLAPLVVYSADFVAVERSLTRQLRELRSWLAARGGDGSPTTGDLAWRLSVLHALQAQLGSLYELHSTLLESTQDLIAIFGADRRLLLSNRAFAAVFADDARTGVPLEQVRSRLSPHPDAPLVGDDNKVEGEAHVGERLYFVRVVPLPPTRLSPGGGWVMILTDLAARVDRDRARAEALGFVTHELRTPLVSIQGFAQVMMEYPGSPACDGAPQTIFRESRRLLALINSYLDVLRLDAGARPICSEQVNLDAVVKQVFDILQPLAAAADMRLQYQSANLVVMADELLITGAVLNLVSNAVKYGTPGTEIRVTCSASATGVALGVHNRGTPVRESELARLHDPFYRSSDVESAKTGWGLGLAFVKRIAEKHGGTVDVRNFEDGVIFELHLPAAVQVLAARGAV